MSLAPKERFRDERQVNRVTPVILCNVFTHVTYPLHPAEWHYRHFSLFGGDVSPSLRKARCWVQWRWYATFERCSFVHKFLLRDSRWPLWFHLAGGIQKLRNHDTDLLFRQESDFLYIHVVLVYFLDWWKLSNWRGISWIFYYDRGAKRFFVTVLSNSQLPDGSFHSTLVAPDQDERYPVWNGTPLPFSIWKERTGVDEVFLSPPLLFSLSWFSTS